MYLGRDQAWLGPLRDGGHLPPSAPEGSQAALAYYDAEGGEKLGDRFFQDAEDTAARVIANPRGFHYIEEGYRRRASLRSFPYHLIYEER